MGRCRACGRVFHPWANACPHCFSSDVQADTVPGSGTVYSFSVVHRGTSSRFGAATPYVLALIDLAPGLRVLGNIVGIANEGLVIGAQVRLCPSGAAEDREQGPLFIFCLDGPPSPDEAVPEDGAPSPAEAAP